MRYFLPLLFLSFSVFAQNECEQIVSSSAKKHFKKQKMLLGIGNMEKHIHF